MRRIRGRKKLLRRERGRRSKIGMVIGESKSIQCFGFERRNSEA